ncbi:hypothetical protein BDR22DRAFT_972802 [Usnea florida]
MARLNTRKSSRISAIEKTIKGTDIKKAMDDYKNQAKNGQKPASDAPKRKRGGPVRQDTPIKKNRRSERHLVQHPIAPNRHSQTVSTLVESQDRGGERNSLDSIVNRLLNSDDEGSGGYVDDTESAMATSSLLDQSSQKVTWNADRKNIEGLLDNNGESDGDFKGSAGPQSAVTMHLDDPGQTHYYDKATQTYSHDRATDQAQLSDQSRTNTQEWRGQTSEYDLSLSEYLSIQSIRFDLRLEDLEATIYNCDQSLRNLNDADISGENHLDAQRKDTQAAKECLNEAQQMEQNVKSMHGMGGDDEAGALRETFQNYLKGAREWRESLQALFEKKEADLKAMEAQANTRQEEISRVQREKQNARDELQVWKEWKDNEGKIFPR